MRSRTKQSGLSRSRALPSLLLVAVAVLGVGLPATQAAILSVPSEYPSIPWAIEAAVDGDVVLVSPGTYVGRINFAGKDITVASTDGPEVTILQGGAGSVVIFENGESSLTGLFGFTITGGRGTPRSGPFQDGGGVYCKGASPVIAGNHFYLNRVSGDGGGIFCVDGSSPEILDNVFEYNEAGGLRPEYQGFGGAVYCRASSARVIGNRFAFNQAYYGFGSDGGAIACVGGSTMVVLHNEFERNRTANPGTCAGLWVTGGSTAEVADNRFVSHIGASALRFEGVEDLVLLRNDFTGSSLRLVDCPGARVEGSRFQAGRLFLDGCGDAVIRNVACTDVSSRGIELRNCLPTVHLTNVTLFEAPLHIALTDVVATNCILWRFAPLPIVTGGTHRLTASYCNIRQGWPGEGNFDADPLLLSYRDGDVRLRPESPCIDAGTDQGIELPGTDVDGDPRSLPGRAGQPNRVDIGADEMRIEEAVRFGSTGLGRTGEKLDEPVLLVNGSAGERAREVEVTKGESLRIEAVIPGGGPDPAAFCVYVWSGEPAIDTVTPQPGGLGFMAFPTPLDGTPGAPAPLAIFNNLGAFPRLGKPTRPSQPAPSILVDHADGLPAGRTVTIQGFMIDARSASAVGASVTNAVVIRSR